MARIGVVSYVCNMYGLLIISHILAAMVWVGGAFVLVVAFAKVRSTDGDDVADYVMGHIDRAVTWVFLPAPFVVVATGLTMVAVNEAWAFSQVWVYLALALFVVTLVLGAGFGDRLEKKMRAARAEGRVASELFDRWLSLFWVELGVIITIILLMVYKPI